ncbi:MAG: hypothetical protein AVDCRST_MAG61-1318 [uncultured Friedmanniella sp.]|uniref:Uncharacterized protein n=1 Tax=uncultured Friedmanniella sp. TaxID=335381 RepID=A0A6J4KFQ2_9ACTN|nr:MAG: hypothetical protein AVDCRST_MAG61-1318 [uncultured Friedmanniella sp.]
MITEIPIPVISEAIAAGATAYHPIRSIAIQQARMLSGSSEVAATTPSTR